MYHLGFFEEDAATGEMFIPEHKLRDILVNFNESCLSLDGSTIMRGGRLEASWEDSGLPSAGKFTTSKTPQTTTMIWGSNAL
jgi:hypothetical protein